jgi:uncharacterized membrane protein YpjA
VTHNPLSRSLARFYLTTPWVVSLLLVGNGVAFLVGVRYYLDTMASVPTLLWPLYGDSPTALALATLVLATTLPALSEDFWGVDAATPDRSRDPDVTTSDGSRRSAGTTDHTTDSVLDRRVPGPLAVLSTLAVVWLVETGVWTAVALNVPLVRPDLPVDLYVGFDGDSLWAYWGIVLTHLAFLAEAALVAHLGRTTRRLLGGALLLALVSDLFDYGAPVGLPTAGHPPIRCEPRRLLAAGSVATSLVGVAAASILLDGE